MEEKPCALQIFKALGDESRLRIVGMLTHGEAYVELIASRLGLTSATVSHHLKKLEEAGLVECHRTQFYMIYSLAEKLSQLPSQNKKREVILRHILSQLEKKDAYTESEIDEHIKMFHDDYCCIRREMISFGLLSREHESGVDLYHRTDA